MDPVRSLDGVQMHQSTGVPGGIRSLARSHDLGQFAWFRQAFGPALAPDQQSSHEVHGAARSGISAGRTRPGAHPRRQRAAPTSRPQQPEGFLGPESDRSPVGAVNSSCDCSLGSGPGSDPALAPILGSPSGVRPPPAGGRQWPGTRLPPPHGSVCRRRAGKTAGWQRVARHIPATTLYLVYTMGKPGVVHQRHPLGSADRPGRHPAPAPAPAPLTEMTCVPGGLGK